MIARITLLLGLALAPLRADIEFVGILVTSRATHFALGDTTTGHTDWVALGAMFSGHKLVRYDRAEDTLTLVRDGKELRVRLKDDAKIKSSRLELTGTITFGATEQIHVERATLLYDQENVFPLKDGSTYRITPQRRSDGNLLYKITLERAVANNRTEKVAAPAVVTLPGQPFHIQIGDELSFRFAPR